MERPARSHSVDDIPKLLYRRDVPVAGPLEPVQGHIAGPWIRSQNGSLARGSQRRDLRRPVARALATVAESPPPGCVPIAVALHGPG